MTLSPDGAAKNQGRRMGVVPVNPCSGKAPGLTHSLPIVKYMLCGATFRSPWLIQTWVRPGSMSNGADLRKRLVSSALAV
jgi:hypothetical protein